MFREDVIKFDLFCLVICLNRISIKTTWNLSFNTKICLMESIRSQLSFASVCLCKRKLLIILKSRFINKLSRPVIGNSNSHIDIQVPGSIINGWMIFMKLVHSHKSITVSIFLNAFFHFGRLVRLLAILILYTIYDFIYAFHLQIFRQLIQALKVTILTP